MASISEWFFGGQVPEGWKMHSTTRRNEMQYDKYSYVKQANEKLSAPPWRSLNQVHDLFPPFGHIGRTGDKLEGKKDWSLRILGYFPIFGFIAGFEDMKHAIEMIFKRVILNDNRLDRKEVSQNDKKRLVLSVRSIHPVELSLTQRIALLSMSIVLLFRGLITFCQLGCLFYPFDEVANVIHAHYIKA